MGRTLVPPVPLRDSGNPLVIPWNRPAGPVVGTAPQRHVRGAWLSIIRVGTVDAPCCPHAPPSQVNVTVEPLEGSRVAKGLTGGVGWGVAVGREPAPCWTVTYAP